MGTRAIDYRVSAIVVLCKDCGNDVGLYPARHVCHDNQRPLLPASGDSDSGSSFASHRSQRPWISRHGSDASISSVESMKKTRVSSSSDEDDPQHESIYYKHFEACLPPTTGKRLWGVVRQNEKFKELNEKTTTVSGRLWEKLLQATQTLTTEDEHEPESDDSDWEGESHVSRILREYYEKKQKPLPAWMRYERSSQGPTAEYEKHLQGGLIGRRDSSRRRLWETTENPEMSPRERERQALRCHPPTRRHTERRKVINHQAQVMLIARSRSQRQLPKEIYKYQRTAL